MKLLLKIGAILLLIAAVSVPLARADATTDSWVCRERLGGKSQNAIVEELAQGRGITDPETKKILRSYVRSTIQSDCPQGLESRPGAKPAVRPAS